MGWHCEWYQHIRHRNVRKIPIENVELCISTGTFVAKAKLVKGMYLAPHIHEHFTIHKWLRQTAYILTHNLNNLEHIANNCMSAMTHTDVTIAHH